MMGKRRRGARDRERVGRLLKTVRGAKRLLILVHDSPDPDAVASAAALRYLLKTKARLEPVVAYGGIVGRAENRAMLRAVGFEMQHVRAIDFSECDRIALVDTQPGTGNNSLPPGTAVHVVIDHHVRVPATRLVPFVDIRRRYGATTTILYGYLKAARLDIPDDLAVAMLYGIRTDTMELGRYATKAETTAYLHLYPRVDKRVLARIAHADLPAVYFQLLATALNRTEVAGNVVTSDLGDLNNPDMIAEVADLLLRLEDTQWVLCSGFFERRLLASVRTADPNGDAHKVLLKVIEGLGTGGGHRLMAGAQIPVATDTVAERERLTREIETRFRAVLGAADRTPRPLLAVTSTTAVVTTSEGA